MNQEVEEMELEVVALTLSVWLTSSMACLCLGSCAIRSSLIFITWSNDVGRNPQQAHLSPQHPQLLLPPGRQLLVVLHLSVVVLLHLVVVVLEGVLLLHQGCDLCLKVFPGVRQAFLELLLLHLHMGQLLLHHPLLLLQLALSM